MRARLLLALVLSAVVAATPAAALADDPPDGLHWKGHSACATGSFDTIDIEAGIDNQYLAVTGTVKPCTTVKPGDFFVLAFFPYPTGTPAALMLYDQAPSTYFAGTFPLTDPVPVCLASWYSDLMACFTIKVVDNTWTILPLATTDPSVAGGISRDKFNVDPKCATCWPE
jgi:hypothetical protein